MRPATLALTLLLLALLAPPASAQWYGGLSFTTGLPQNEFEAAQGDPAFGVSLSALYHFQTVPIAVGIEGQAMTYGSRRRAVTFDGIPEVDLDVVTDNNIAQGLVVLRLQPDWGRLRPYAEAVGGVSYLFTQSRIEDDYYHETLAADTNYDDFALTGGGGVGALVEVYRSSGKSRRGPTEVLVDLRVRYLLGAEANYLTEGDLDGRDGRLRLTPRRSRTDLLVPQIGVAVRF
jgi:hypothetical protein